MEAFYNHGDNAREGQPIVSSSQAGIEIEEESSLKEQKQRRINPLLSGGGSP